MNPKDLHRLKERTKYLVPSMARVAPRMSRCSAHGPPPLHASALGVALEDERRGSACTPTAIPQSTGYSITMATRQCQDELPHYEHGCDDDCYCPGVTAMPSRAEGLYVRPDQPRSSRSSNSSAGRSDDDNWRMISPEDAPATGQRAVQPCQSPHYSSRSSSLSDRLSVYGGTRSPACVPRSDCPACPGHLTRGVPASEGAQWRFINVVVCARLRRRACGTER
ncbi:hypothetical protein ON010_g4504 [Phytophthora cinnamomi]|nr:hypothetical protein ON010_g4504 [Phytophthora cinnamomi]